MKCVVSYCKREAIKASPFCFVCNNVWRRSKEHRTFARMLIARKRAVREEEKTQFLRMANTKMMDFVYRLHKERGTVVIKNPTEDGPKVCGKPDNEKQPCTKLEGHQPPCEPAPRKGHVGPFNQTVQAKSLVIGVALQGKEEKK